MIKWIFVSLVHRKLAKFIATCDISSTSLRRKSIVQILLTNILSENDNEAKCIAHEIFTTSTSQSTSNNQRYSQGLESLTNIPIQIAENINQCIKLSAKNKINIKNAFNLEMIDFMMYMIKKQDANISNLQVASISLDVSTKIYGYRVDNVYTEILKMVDGLDKQITDDMEQNSEEREKTVQKDAKARIVMKKKKKKTIKKILSTVEALRDKIEIAKPRLTTTGERDVQTSDMLYQATLPNHANSGFYQHPYNDVFIDVLEDTFKLRNNSNVKYAILAIEDFSNLEICASYSNFEFLDWSVEDEPEEMPEKETECNDDSGNRFKFDLDASIEHDDDPMLESMDFDIDDDDNENVQAYYQANVVEDTFMHNDRESEYSFQPSMSLHWADLSYWKFRNSARFSAITEADTNMLTCLQSKLRKRKQFELSYDNRSDIVDAKFASSQCNKLRARTIKAEWSAKNLTLPEDVHYDVAQMNKFYLYQRAVRPVNNEEKEDENMVIASDDGKRYDYNNPIDTLEYCPNVEYNVDYRSRDSNFDDNAAVLDSQVLISDNQAVIPKLINKISIAKPKKIDMQELKKSIWSCLKSKNNKAANTGETVDEIETMKESKKFSDVYKMLPKLLTKSNAEALSVPISFVSMLHLANEKALEIRSERNMSDVIIEPGESLLN